MQGEWIKADTMPLMLELKYEYFPATWPGRIKLLELVSAPIHLRHIVYKCVRLVRPPPLALRGPASHDNILKSSQKMLFTKHEDISGMFPWKTLLNAKDSDFFLIF